jgi:hypothetical protein
MSDIPIPQNDPDGGLKNPSFSLFRMMAAVCPVEDSRKKAMSGLPDYRQTPAFFQPDTGT